MDEAAFSEAAERHRHELRVHCYRMLGSFTEAEDLVQETFLRAWRARDGFEGRSSVRAWLYRIATNACLDAAARGPRQSLPFDVVPAAPTAGAGAVDALPPPGGGPWLEPYPDEELDRVPDGAERPDAAAISRETIELAFLAALQHLPPRQRAVLLLRDVLGRPAADVAETLELSVAAVKSALQRARATLREQLPERRADWAPREQPSGAERAVLRRYMAAVEAGDQDAVAELLAEDARAAHPPRPFWTDGRDAHLAGARRFAAPGEYRLVATAANRQPAIAIHVRPPGAEDFRLLVLEVLRIEDGRITELVDFHDEAVLHRFLSGAAEVSM